MLKTCTKFQELLHARNGPARGRPPTKFHGEQYDAYLKAKDELIDYSIRTGAPLEVVENLQAIEDEGDLYESIQEIWADYPTDEDYLWNEDEY